MVVKNSNLDNFGQQVSRKEFKFSFESELFDAQYCEFGYSFWIIFAFSLVAVGSDGDEHEKKKGEKGRKKHE